MFGLGSAGEVVGDGRSRWIGELFLLPSFLYEALYPKREAHTYPLRPSQVRIWDVKTGKPVGDALVGHSKWITSLAWEPAHLFVSPRFHTPSRPFRTDPYRVFSTTGLPPPLLVSRLRPRTEPFESGRWRRVGRLSLSEGTPPVSTSLSGEERVSSTLPVVIGVFEFGTLLR